MFERKTRPNGDTFTALSDDAPQWLKDAVQEAHHGTMPCDWIYSECSAAYDAYSDLGVADCGDVCDLVHEHADSMVDVNTQRLAQWHADMCLTDLFAHAEDRAAEYGGRDDATTNDRLGVLQYCAVALITEAIWTAIKENTDDDD
jgi:hypothetical protein